MWSVVIAISWAHVVLPKMTLIESMSAMAQFISLAYPIGPIHFVYTFGDCDSRVCSVCLPFDPIRWWLRIAMHGSQVTTVYRLLAFFFSQMEFVARQ